MLAALGEEAVEVDIEGRRAWVLARDVREMTRAESPDAARLLPAFDPWVAGASRVNAALLEPRYRARVYRGQKITKTPNSALIGRSARHFAFAPGRLEHGHGWAPHRLLPGRIADFQQLAAGGATEGLLRAFWDSAAKDATQAVAALRIGPHLRRLNHGV